MIATTPVQTEKTIQMVHRLIGQEEEIFSAAVEEIPSLLLGWNIASLYIYNEAERVLELKSCTGSHELPKRVSPGGTPTGLMGYVFRTGRPLLLNETARFRREHRMLILPASRPYSHSSSALMPILITEKRKSPRPIGVLNMTGTGMSEWESSDQSLTLCYQWGILLGRAITAAQEARQMKFLAQQDLLTGLYNYRFFYEHLEYETRRSRRTKKPLALMILDIDSFKKFNDRFGHLAGDTVLREVAKVITGQLREMDIACRYGGDEFLVILPDTDLPGARRVSRRVKEAVAATPLIYQDRAFRVAISTGVSQYQEGRSHADLIEQADRELLQI